MSNFTGLYELNELTPTRTRRIDYNIGELKNLPSFPDLVLQGLDGYDPSDYEFIEYVFRYEGKVDYNGRPVPRIAGLKFRNVHTEEIHLISKTSGGGFECESILKE